VVDDNELNQAVATHLLKRANIDVDVCQNGDEALTQVQLKPYKAVFMDIQMPVMDGLEATRKIRSFGGHYADIPIVAMTAHATQEHRKESYDAGMDAHISKPVEPMALYRILSRYIEVESVNERNEKLAVPVSTEHLEHASEQVAMNLPKRLEGLDIAEALDRLGGNEQFYIKLITTFYHSQSSLVQDIEEALANEDTDRARLLLHSTKSSAENIGAHELSEVACQFEQAILGLINEFVIVRNDNTNMTDREAVDLLQQIYGSLHEDISNVESLVTILNSRPYDGHHRACIEKLSQNLQASDIAGAEQTLAVLFDTFEI
jgi:polar amino acid transport system substrate-binding protein